jgi:hypothetical protein
MTSLPDWVQSWWQPIETAPKDGSPILIWQPGQEWFNKVNSTHDDYRYAIGYWRPEGGWGNRNSAHVEPTHWMPLPPKPV